MAKNDPGDLVAGAGLLTGIFTALRDEVTKRGGTSDDIHRLTRPEGRDTIVKMAELIAGENGEGIYELEVDYGGSVGAKRVRFRELAFDHDPLDDEVLARMAALHCRQPEEVEARKAIGRYTSDQLRKHPRVGLIGPAVRRRGSLDRADVTGNEDGVESHWYWTARWPRHYRFVVVCK